MRVLTLINAYPPHYYGGYELTCADVMERWLQAGHDVHVLTSTARVPGVQEPDRHRVWRTLEPYWDWETNQADAPATPIGVLQRERHNLAQIRAALEATRPDVVSVWHMIGLSMSLLEPVRRSRRPVVVTVGNDWLIEAPDFDPWSRWSRRWPLRWPKNVAGVPVGLPPLAGARMNFVSEFIKRRALERSHWPVDPRSEVVPPGIDLTDFPISPRPASSWSWRLLYVGRVDPVKGVATLIRGFADLPPAATLQILGGGPAPYIQQMKELARDLGVAERVSFGWCYRHELRDRYRAADAVVFPSEWHEPFGLVPLEAMACGVPVVATATGGAAEFLHDRVNCLLFDAGNADSMVGAVMALADDPQLRDTLAHNGNDTAAALTIDRYAEKLLALHRYGVDD